MKKETVEKLNKLNREFYAKQAESFSSTRQEKWQGWENLFPYMTENTSEAERLRILDIGCGNGRFAKFLMYDREIENAHYVGVDSSSELIEIAKKELVRVNRNLGLSFIVADVMDIDALNKKLAGEKFDRIVLFGVMHHIPGFENRVKLLMELTKRLSPGGQLYVTFWQFLRSKRAPNWAIRYSEVERLLGKETAQELLKDFEENDYLLDWDKSGTPRYCHYFSDEEVDKIAKELIGAGLMLFKDFNADGKEGNLNRYLVLKKI